jgi:hypothetical protein
MKNAEDFIQYLAGKKKKQNYIDERVSFISGFYDELNGECPTPESIDAFVRNRWSGYVSRDKDTFAKLNEYAEACEQFDPAFASAFHTYVQETFEGETRKAMRAYKDGMVFIPDDTVIDPVHLGNLSNADFVRAFKSLQEFLCAVYDEIERGAPFNWGFPTWSDLTGNGLIQNRVVMLLNALVSGGYRDNNVLIVDKQCFKRIDEPMKKTTLLLNKLCTMGMQIEGYTDTSISAFSVSFPDIPHAVTVICEYFKNANHVRYFSYRFMQDPTTQTHETFFLAKTDSEPPHLREIYYWLYDDAVKHGFQPTGEEKMYCYLYKKGSKEWLLVGKGSSYHEEEFLHSVNHTLSVKFAFPKIYHTHSEKIEWIKHRFPESFATRWGGCYKCKEKKGTIKKKKNRVIINPDKRMGCVKGYFYFHNPTFDDIKEFVTLYKLENRIK